VGSCSFVYSKGVDRALRIQLLRAHLLSNLKNEKQIAELIDKGKYQRIGTNPFAAWKYCLKQSSIYLTPVYQFNEQTQLPMFI
jgi:hypothetical protein